MQWTWAKNRCMHNSAAALTFGHIVFLCLHLELRAQVEIEAFMTLHDTLARKSEMSYLKNA